MSTKTVPRRSMRLVSSEDLDFLGEEEEKLLDRKFRSKAYSLNSFTERLVRAHRLNMYTQRDV